MVQDQQDTAQTLIRGMGELHMEIIHDRLKNHYKVNCSLGEMQIAYKSALREGIPVF